MKFNSNKTMPKDEAKPSVYHNVFREYPAISLINEKPESIGLFCLSTAIAKRYKQIQRITKKSLSDRWQSRFVAIQSDIKKTTNNAKS